MESPVSKTTTTTTTTTATATATATTTTTATPPPASSLNFLQCSHVGCDFVSEAKSAAQQRKCVAIHERSIVKHRTHYIVNGSECECCRIFIQSGVWSVDAHTASVYATHALSKRGSGSGSGSGGGGGGGGSGDSPVEGLLQVGHANLDMWAGASAATNSATALARTPSTTTPTTLVNSISGTYVSGSGSGGGGGGGGVSGSMSGSDGWARATGPVPALPRVSAKHASSVSTTTHAPSNPHTTTTSPTTPPSPTPPTTRSSKRKRCEMSGLSGSGSGSGSGECGGDVCGDGSSSNSDDEPAAKRACRTNKTAHNEPTSDDDALATDILTTHSLLTTLNTKVYALPQSKRAVRLMTWRPTLVGMLSQLPARAPVGVEAEWRVCVDTIRGWLGEICAVAGSDSWSPTGVAAAVQVFEGDNAEGDVNTTVAV